MTEVWFDHSAHRGWALEKGYRQGAADALRAAQTDLARTNASRDDIESTYGKLVELTREPMSRRQHEHTSVVAAQAARKIGEYDLALRWAQRALDLALLLADSDALIPIHQEFIPIYRATSQLSKAGDECHLIITHMRNLRAANRSLGATAEAQALVLLAGFEFFQAHDTLAETHLDQARALYRMTAATALDIAPIEWICAHIEHGRGHLGDAFDRALAAASIYAAADDACSTSRVKSLVAEIALDRAEAFEDPASEARHFYLKVAELYIKQAVMLAPRATDPGGHGLAALQRAHYERLCGNAPRATATTEGVAKTAHRLGDLALLAQARTSLARLLEVQGEIEAALVLYSETLDLVAGGDFTVLGLKAQRAILHASEMGYDVFS